MIRLDDSGVYDSEGNMYRYNVSIAEVESENKKTILKYFLMLNRTGKAMDKAQLDKVEDMLNELT